MSQSLYAAASVCFLKLRFSSEFSNHSDDTSVGVEPGPSRFD